MKKLALADVDTEGLFAVKKEILEVFPDVHVLDLSGKCQPDLLELRSAKVCTIANLPCTVNVRDTASVESALSQTVKAFERLDVAVNAAGVGPPPKPTHEQTDEDWLRVVDINLNGVWRCEKEELKIMLQQQ
jgi:NAD(P)-dependent dehydrogenase (short-subunit alcohol dehydrogenase family)